MEPDPETLAQVWIPDLAVLRQLSLRGLGPDSYITTRRILIEVKRLY